MAATRKINQGKKYIILNRGQTRPFPSGLPKLMANQGSDGVLCISARRALEKERKEVQRPEDKSIPP